MAMMVQLTMEYLCMYYNSIIILLSKMSSIPSKYVLSITMETIKFIRC